MKNRIVQTLILLCLPVWLCAGPVEEEAARQLAIAFLDKYVAAGSSRRAARQQQVKLLYAKRDVPSEAPLLYVFGDEENGGYVIVAGEEEAVAPVLGFSDKRKFDVDDIPCCLSFLLDEYGHQLAYAREHPSAQRRSEAVNVKPSIAPFITSKWAQRAPFNNLCPEVNSTHCSTGCVATAMAQFMYYYKWPKQGVDSHSYNWNSQTLSVDFGATTYQWDKMKDVYSGEDDDPDDAVATLMYHCGVAVEMKYTTGASGAYMSKLVTALTTYFNYSKIENMEARVPNNTEDRLYAELSVGCPIIVEGANSNSYSSHVFLCDGYKDGYFHFNFGWGGDCDDYYLLTAIRPQISNYSDDISYYYGFRKSGFEIDGMEYGISGNGSATLLKGNATGEISIPETILIDGHDYIVKAIEDGAFSECKTLTSVIIPATVTSIGNNAFKNCTMLASVTIPESVTYIGSSAFDNTPWYEGQPNGMLYIGKVAYKYKGTMPDNTSIALKDGIVSISSKAFNKCTQLTSVSIPEGVKTIGASAFNGCTGLTSVVIPKSMASMGSSVFNGCTGLTSVMIYCPVIGPWFSGRVSITELTLGDEVTAIAPYAFQGCTKLTSFLLPPNLTSIGESAFYGCIKLSSLAIPDKVQSIGKSAFEGCKALTSLTIGKGLTEMDATSFKNCTALSTINFNCPTVKSWFQEMSCIKEVVMGDYVKTIDYRALYKCSGLESLTLSSSVNSIGNYAFQGCTLLTSVVIPGSVTEIGLAAFQDCIGLETASLGTGVQKIGQYVFCNCSKLSAITIPDGVTSLGGNVFQNCTALTTISVPHSVTYLGNCAFQGCEALTSATIGTGVTYIRSSLFEGCTALTTVSILGELHGIGNKAFYGCSSLEEAVIPEGVTTIEAYAFNGCSKISAVTIPSTITRVESYVFKNCESLTSVTFNCPKASGYFANMENIKEVTLGPGVTAIAGYAFKGCTGLTHVNIPDGLTSIGDEAFSGCTALTSIRIPATVSTIGELAFYQCSTLVSVRAEGLTPLTEVKGTSFPLRANTTLYVSAGTKAAYKAANYWQDFKNIIEIGDANADGNITITDAEDIVNNILGNPSADFDKEAANINGDIDDNGDPKITITDAVGVVNIILNNGSSNAPAQITKSTLQPPLNLRTNL